MSTGWKSGCNACSYVYLPFLWLVRSTISSATGLTRWEGESLHNSVIAMGLTQADRDLSLILGKREELSLVV